MSSERRTPVQAIHCLSIAYSLPIHCLFTAYSLPIHCLFTAYSLPIDCLFTAASYSLPIHCLFTASYSLPITAYQWKRGVGLFFGKVLHCNRIRPARNQRLSLPVRRNHCTRSYCSLRSPLPNRSYRSLRSPVYAIACGERSKQYERVAGRTAPLPFSAPTPFPAFPSPT
jgi:hypothetical protein